MYSILSPFYTWCKAVQTCGNSDGITSGALDKPSFSIGHHEAMLVHVRPPPCKWNTPPKPLLHKFQLYIQLILNHEVILVSDCVSYVSYVSYVSCVSCVWKSPASYFPWQILQWFHANECDFGQRTWVQPRPKGAQRPKTSQRLRSKPTQAKAAEVKRSLTLVPTCQLRVVRF